MQIYIYSVGHQSWVLIPDQNEARLAMALNIMAAGFVMACDLGITGVVFEVCGHAMCALERPGHIVDVRGTSNFYGQKTVNIKPNAPFCHIEGAQYEQV